MTTINNLSSVDSLASGDQFPIYDASNGDARKVSASALLTFFQSNFASPDVEVQITAPTSSGFNLQMTASTDSIWAIINPTGAFAAATITLPALSDSFDGQEILVTCSNSITALTVDGNAAIVIGAPTTLGVGGFFALRFRESQGTWYTTSQSLGANSTFTDITITNAILDSNGNEALQIGATANAVNFIRIENGATGGEVEVKAAGSDTNIDLTLVPKGATGNLQINCGGVAFLNSVEITTKINTQTLENKTLDAATTNFNGYIRQSVYLVGVTLPAAAIGLLGARAFVTNSSVTTFNSIVAGGGANGVPVFCDGTDWRVG